MTRAAERGWCAPHVGAARPRRRGARRRRRSVRCVPSSPDSGAAIGVCAVVTVLGLTASASAQVNERFDALRAREVTVTAADRHRRRLEVPPTTVRRCPIDAAAARIARDPAASSRRARRHGRRSATAIASLRSRSPATAPSRAAVHSTSAPSTAAAWTVLHPHVAVGRLFDAGHERRADRVAVLGIGRRRAGSASAGSTRSPRCSSTASRSPWSASSTTSGASPTCCARSLLPAGRRTRCGT